MPIEDKYAEDDGVKIHYLVSGPANAPLVVMIHGYPDYSETWAQLKVDFTDSMMEICYLENGAEKCLNFKSTSI